jgi:hypothetical protein
VAEARPVAASVWLRASARRVPAEAGTHTDQGFLTPRCACNSLTSCTSVSVTSCSE